jgi:hypothetical protein
MSLSQLSHWLHITIDVLAMIAMVGCDGGEESDSHTLQSGGTGTAVLSWAPPSMNTDGTPVDLLGFMIYAGPSPQSLQAVRMVSAIDMNAIIDNLPAGVHFFAITAVSINGAQSAFSNVESKTIG